MKRCPILLEWNELSFEARCCLGEMAGLKESFVENVLAKQNADEIDDWIKGMLVFNLEKRTQNRVQFDFEMNESWCARADSNL
ncbi:MAG: hypothetical protein WCJ11_04330 [Methylococcaceae bacterium]